MKTNSDLKQRISVLKALLGYNGQQMADELGISRQTLTNAIGPNPKRGLSDGAMMRLQKLEDDQSLVIKKKQGQSAQAAAKTVSDCAQCLAYEEEVRYLRDALAKANENLSAMIELMQQKNDVTLASSASSGYGANKANKKGA